MGCGAAKPAGGAAAEPGGKPADPGGGKKGGAAARGAGGGGATATPEPTHAAPGSAPYTAATLPADSRRPSGWQPGQPYVRLPLPALAAATVPPGAPPADVRWDADGAELKLGEVLASGNFGSVRLAQWHGLAIAVKGIRTKGEVKAGSEGDAERLRLAEATAALRSEIVVHAALRHPNIVEYLGTIGEKGSGSPRSSGGEIMLLMEFCPGPSLFTYCQAHAEDDGWDASTIIVNAGTQVAAALHYLHSDGWVHRDVRCANVFVCQLPPHALYKLGDFGLARDEGEDLLGGDGAEDEPENFPWPWTAPEALSKRLFDKASDCWSLGVLLWEIATGARRRPYVADFADGRAALVNGEQLPHPEELSSGPGREAWDKVILQLWLPREERMTAAAAYEACCALRGKPATAPSPRALPQTADRAGSVGSGASGRSSPSRRRSMMSDKQGKVERRRGGKEVALSEVALGGDSAGRIRFGSWRHCPVAVKRAGTAELSVLSSLRHPHMVQYLAHTPCRHVILARCASGRLDDFARTGTAAADRELYWKQHCGGEGQEADAYNSETPGELDAAELETRAKQREARLRMALGARVLRWAAQIASAVNFLHEQQVCHGAVRAANVLVDDGGLHCRLASFSRGQPPAGKGLPRGPSECDSAGAAGMESPRGEPDPEAWRWRPPGKGDDAAATQPGDVWALGVLVWELMGDCAALPYPDAGGRAALSAGAPPPCPSACDDVVWQEAAAPCFRGEGKRYAAVHVVRSMYHAQDALVGAGLELIGTGTNLEHSASAMGQSHYDSGAQHLGFYTLMPHPHNDRALYGQLTGEHWIWWSHKERQWLLAKALDVEVTERIEGPSCAWPWQQSWSGDFMMMRLSRDDIMAAAACLPAPEIQGAFLGGTAVSVADRAFPEEGDEEYDEEGGVECDEGDAEEEGGEQ